MDIRLDWLGCATFRLAVDDLVVFLDAYMDRVPSAPPVGLSTAEVKQADFVLVGHSHFDHIAGAEVIAKNTGATVIGSLESGRVMRDAGVPGSQIQPAQGGEHYRLNKDVTVRVFPSLHSCIWVSARLDETGRAYGHLNLTEDERAQQRGLGAALRGPAGADESQAQREMREHLANACGSSHTGGALAYVIETPLGSIFYQDTSGCWTGVLQDLRPDVAILAAAGRGNIDGEPIQGSLAEFVGLEARLLKPKTIILGHHDNWMPPSTREGGTDISSIKEELGRVAHRSQLLEPGYMEGTRLFAS